jgi:mono/diheme cytochrome c family protein
MVHRLDRAVAAAAAIALTALLLTPSQAAEKADKQVKRGQYLVTLGGCTDCHTPGTFLGKPDMTRFLGGSDVGFYLPDMGTFYGRNLTPDKATGLGTWTSAEIVTALTTGKRPDGRMLAPIMPWRAYAKLSKADAYAIAAYLKSLPPIENKVPGPFGARERPTSFAMKVVPPDQVLPAK